MKYLRGILCKSFQFMILGGVMFSPSLSWGQQQNAPETTYNKPDVEINRTVLKELKGYEPPSMFSKPEPPITTPAPDVPARLKPIQSVDVVPSLTAPKAEDLLEYPTQNFHVLTEQKGSLTLPLGEALPVPVAPKKTEKTALKTVAKKTEKAVSPPKSIVKKEPAIKTYVIPARLEDRDKDKGSALKQAKQETKTAALPNDFVMPKVEPKPYKLKAAKTMPAVPSVGVEKLALPPTAADESMAAKPSIGDKIIDQTLDSHMEQDTSKITAAITGEIPEEAIAAPKQMSFEFKPKITDLSKDQIQQLDKSIMPSLKKDKASRIEIRSFSATVNGDESGARRVALSRALAMRQYFVDKGITPARMDLRALGNETGGNETDEMPQDRIDLQIK